MIPIPIIVILVIVLMLFVIFVSWTVISNVIFPKQKQISDCKCACGNRISLAEKEEFGYCLNCHQKENRVILKEMFKASIEATKTEQDKPTDTEILDWLETNETHYKILWVCKGSANGRWLQLYRTRQGDAKPTVREAIVAAMEKAAKRVRQGENTP